MTPLAQAAYRAHEAHLVATGRVLPRQPMIFTLGRDAAAFAASTGAEPSPVPVDPSVGPVPSEARSRARSSRVPVPAPVPAPGLASVENVST